MRGRLIRISADAASVPSSLYKKEAPDPAKRGSASGMRQSAATASGLLPVGDDGSKEESPVFVENDFANGDAEKESAGETRREKLPPGESVPAFTVSGNGSTRVSDKAAPYCGRRTEALLKFGKAISDSAS